MNKVEVIKGIDATIAGLTAIKNALSSDGGSLNVAPKTEKTEEVESNTTGVKSAEELKGMKYNEFKKYAASLGVDCKGTRDEIMKRVLDHLNGESTDDADEETEAPAVEVEAPKKVAEELVEEEKTEKAPKKKLGKKLKKDEFDEMAEQYAEENTSEDIIDALADVDIKATKDNYVQKLAEAFRTGAIEVDDDDEETSEEAESEDDAEEGEDLNADSYFPEVDPDGINNPDEMTDERKSACHDLMTKFLEEVVSDDNIDVDTINKYLEDHATDDEKELVDMDNELEKLALCMEIKKRYVDDEGDVHEDEDPYEIGEHEMCCGHELQYAEDTKKYVCEVCGTEYEAE